MRSSGFVLFFALTGLLSATPVSSLTAGYFSFTNIECRGQASPCSDVSLSATANGAETTLTLSDNGIFDPTYTLAIVYDLTYVGPGPTDPSYPLLVFTENIQFSSFFLGNTLEPGVSNELPNGAIVYQG